MAADKAAEVVLGTAGPGNTLYTGPFKDYPALLPAYRYHFLTNSKPATHLAALTHIKKKDLVENMPTYWPRSSGTWQNHCGGTSNGGALATGSAG